MIRIIFQRYPKVALLGIFQSVIETVVTYVPLLIMAVLARSIANGDVRTLLMAGLSYALLMASGSVCTKYIEGKIVEQGRLISEHKINSLYIKLCQIPFSLFENADVRGKYLNAIDALDYEFDYCDTILSVIRVIKSVLFIIVSTLFIISLALSNPEQSVGGFSILASPAYSLSLITIVLFLQVLILRRAALFTALNQKKMIDRHASIEHRLTAINNELVYRFENYAEYKIMNMKEMISRRYRECAQDTVRFFMKLRRVYFLSEIASLLVSSMFTLAVFFITVAKVLSGALAAPMIISHTGAALKLFEGISDLMAQYRMLKENRHYYDMVESIMEMEVETKKISETTHVQGRPGIIRFDHVWYKYPNAADYAIKDLCIEIKETDKNILVGENGSGKTTFLLLLLRLIEPERGIITLNGVDISKIPLEEYRSMFASCTQDAGVYSFSLSDNISMQKEALPERMKQALLNATTEDIFFISHSFEDIIDPGHLSGGECQKIAAARALYKDAQILVFDEPTSTFDPISEKKFFDSILQRESEKFLIIVSHRMSSCKQCDNIMVFMDGQIKEHGDHTSLMQNKSKYYALYTAQASLYRENSSS